MPPRQKSKPKGSAPANRVYKAVTPLVQSTLPETKKRPTRSYGRKAGSSVSRQDTLTQMDWVKLHGAEDVELLDSEEENDENIPQGDGAYEEEESKRKTKRRRTLGSEIRELEAKGNKRKNRRRTMGDERATPNYQTQTITQLDWSFSAEPAADDSIYDLPATSSPEVPRRRRSPRKLQVARDSPKQQRAKLPQTPVHKRVLEVPSSQSPATPTSSQFGGSTRRRSPLKEMSANVAIPFSISSKKTRDSGKVPRLKVEDTYETGTDESQALRTPQKPSPPAKLPTLKVEDTYENRSDETQILRTPSKRSSPTKTVRFAIPDPTPTQESVAEETPIKRETWTQRAFSPTLTPRATPGAGSLMYEVLDSDAEEDEIDEEEESQVSGHVELEREVPVISDLEDDEESIVEDSQNDGNAIYPHKNMDSGEQPETCYGGIGMETQVEVERIMTSSSLSSLEKTPSGGEPSSDDLPHDKSQAASYLQSQYQESQRLSTQQLEAMAPRSDGSDIFISIYHTHVQDIIACKKDHEFRAYEFPPTTSRIWMYQTKPLGRLTHMAVISSPKRPGEITNANGLGNSEFNNGKTRSKVAYEILELYELANPISYEELLRRQWFKAAPQRYMRVPPAVLGELIANLMPPIFTQAAPTSGSSPGSLAQGNAGSSSTESQEVEEQISNNIEQFTHNLPSSPPALPSSMSTPKARYPTATQPDPQSDHLPHPSQATTVDYTQTQTETPTQAAYQHPRHDSPPLPDLIPESPPKYITSSSSPQISSDQLPALHRERYHDSAPSSTPPLPYSLIRSSQMITATQVMREQDSLVEREVMGPPGWGRDQGEVEDSDDELE
ncbi:PUA-like domain protein [Rutstroemia sp. NJR-2017a BVV2]|nr:PUA-like domain protein [Rutstroemia sp. NJR-2017a BVV2]